ncbi:aromatic ring-hydroxylating dioxygenase subunit alpha [Sphingomonas sp. MG17]|uniref:Aromatic ring-hydroxylating dioxygenase subunit alpha n=1 Tax=Sphingomonas tagetis TaxID=2949092 RepID=A0A9X2HJS0_9SPHN|nr:aromatic ring-hydroxylating dioxygenase subunit alpha [Sphingomonas tagetis]MCP3731372.1 aromatic ring-hydroxylating dioxygenase subunit alpha [Sphingomonas tagetis]
MRALKNIWYMAAWAEEIQPGELFHRTLLEQHILFFRDGTGAVKAIGNRCPHRFAPLHLGKQVGDAVECRYHGLRFGADGQCVFNPQGNGAIPRAATVPAYATVERYGVVWIWMGDPDRANREVLPQFPILEPADYAVGHGYLKAKAHYELESDNIMDLSHIEFLHPLFSTEAVRRGKTESAQEGDIVWSKRFITDDTLPSFLEEIFGLEPGTPADRWLDCRWQAPALIELYSGATPTGRPREEGREAPSVHFFTPETERTTHYFYGMCCPRSSGGAMADEIARMQTEAVREPFMTEDLPVVEGQQQMIGDVDFWSLKPVLLPGDAGAGRARRVLERRIAAEEAAG